MERELRRESESKGVNESLAAEVVGMMYPYDNGDDGSRERWEPKKLNSMHRQILLLAFNANQTQLQIAEYLKVSLATVNIVVNSELGRMHLEYLHSQLDDNVLEDVEKSITDIQPYAFEIQKQIMLNGSSEGLKLKAAQDFMNRGGIGAKHGGSGDNYGTKSRIDQIKKLAEERKVVARKTTIEEVFINDEPGD